MYGSCYDSSNTLFLDDLDWEYAEHREEQRREKAYQRALMRHPDCRDPDHPGCGLCNEENDEE